MSANQPTLLRSDIDSLEFLRDPATVSVFRNAAETFVKQTGQTTELWAASQDWFLEEWGRDAFISLPGLLLTTGRFNEARQVFRHFAEHMKDGLIPNVIHGDQPSYNTVDASLWYIQALKAYVQATDDWQFGAELMPVVRRILSSYTDGTAYEKLGVMHKIYMDQSDRLIVSPAQATWMDADPAGDGTTIVTPRDGKCVEINALWYSSLRFAVVAERRLNNESAASELEALAARVRESFTHTFWNSENGCLFDVVEGDPHGAAIRPNQITAVSHGDDLLDPEKQAFVLRVVGRELLTLGGLRTLSPSDPQYLGWYDTNAPMSVKDLAYHQGTVWPWLLGPYCDAVWLVRAQQGVPRDIIRHEIGDAIAPLVQFCLDSSVKSLPEVFSGDVPHEPGGTTSQAWSVAEVFRVLMNYCVNDDITRG